jgi:hypothetical protein
VGCQIEDRPGLVLVEAKAHRNELETTGKPLDTTSTDSVENHEHINSAEAFLSISCHEENFVTDRMCLSNTTLTPHGEIRSNLLFF